MNYLKQTTIYTNPNNNTEYKQVYYCEYSDGHRKSKNSFYINGKKVTKQDRFRVEQILLDNSTEVATKEWID